jgi:hypothetical protein
VLQHYTGANGRGQQHGSGQENGVAPTRQTNQERCRNAHGGTRYASDGGQREQLGLGKRKAQVEHLHRDDAPHAPYRKAAQQRRDGYPQIAVSNFFTGGFPKLRVLGSPVGNVNAGCF